MAKINTTDKFPWNEITDVTDTVLSDCVRIPKIFVKNSVDENGLIIRMISNVKIKGYHCHPAFMQDGHERNAILIEKALDAVETQITFDAAKTQETVLKNNYGADYHMYNIYEHHLIALLMLIEYGTTDLQNAMGGSDTATTVDWYGLTQHWGDVGLWIDGIDTKGTDGAVRIFDNLGNFTLQDTGVTVGTGSNGFPKTMRNDSGTNWSFEDIFFGNEMAGFNEFNQGSFGDAQFFGKNYNMAISIPANTDQTTMKWNGAFFMWSQGGQGGGTKAAYRMAKFSN